MSIQSEQTKGNDEERSRWRRWTKCKRVMLSVRSIKMPSNMAFTAWQFQRSLEEEVDILSMSSLVKEGTVERMLDFFHLACWLLHSACLIRPGWLPLQCHRLRGGWVNIRFKCLLRFLTHSLFSSAVFLSFFLLCIFLSPVVLFPLFLFFSVLQIPLLPSFLSSVRVFSLLLICSFVLSLSLRT